MKRYLGGSKVKGSYYWNLKRWSINAVSGDEGPLPGGIEDAYLHIPLLLMFVVAPVFSFTFVVFLPFIGFAMLAYAVIRKIGGLGKGATRKLPGGAHPVMK